MNEPIHSNSREALEGFVKQNVIFVPIAAILLLSLQFQTLPLRIQVQTLPLTSVFALIFFPFVIRNIPRSPLFTVLMVFLGFALLHSSVAVFVDLVSGQADNRFIAWLRQSFALTAGVIVFLVMRVSFLYVSDEQICRWIVLGSIPPILLSLINILWGALGKDWAGRIVVGIRDFVSPDGYTAPLRASGFATEPASWATALVITVLPILLIYLGGSERRRFAFLFFLVCGIVFVWTFSTTGLLLLICVLLSGAVLGPNRKIIFLIVVFLFGFMLSAFVVFPNNQILRHARSLAVGQANLSFSDRYYSALGPFMRALDSYSVVGYGLGGVSTHSREVVPTFVQEEIYKTKWKDFPNLTIMFGRIFAETGATGIVLFLVVIAVTFRELRVLMKLKKDPHSQLVHSSVRLGWIAACIGLFITFGPYQIPYLWLWMAFIDSRYILATRSTLEGVGLQES